MSEPGTNAQIEDVLTSIRRLVSQDAASQPTGAIHRAAPAPRPEKAAEPDAALLLTPAQRIEAPLVRDVAEASERAPAAPPKSEVLILRPAPDLGEELSRLETTIAEMEAAVVASDGEFEPEQGDPFEPEGAAPLEELPEQFDATVFTPQAEDHAEAVPSAEALQDLNDKVLEQVAAEVTEALAPAVVPDAEAELAAWEADLTAEVAAVDVAPEPGVWPGLTEARMVAAVSPATAQGAAEAGFNSTRGHTGAETEAASAALSAVPPMNEAELRALIAEIVRQELQGTLGERITRNVRKLVRREIHRALGSEES
ncbi:hypothetical protein [Pseudothioclava arenosa]|uniref:Uncharacterized protein n=1 Tax=Pseudothioclava arenosa TaxID=1795308 RepID=A0A2A4CUD0_9RHOB|nr:hypothetical protein [Pseudothioclava arenosa]PCD77872.1 hypothetical protein CLN94_00700 [Pseudothioclava arenosa]